MAPPHSVKSPCRRFSSIAKSDAFSNTCLVEAIVLDEIM
jgi:hypothetical protein